MSKKSKTLAREKRLAKKRALKAANKAKYQKWAADGQNTKSFRFRRKKQTKSLKGTHPFYCGNIACEKCFKYVLTGQFPSRQKVA